MQLKLQQMQNKGGKSMDNEKLNNEELNEEVMEETTEEIVDEITEESADDAEAIGEISEVEVMDSLEESEEDSDVEEIDAESMEIIDGSKKILGKKIAVIAGGAVALALIVFFILLNLGVVNPYEDGYIDITGETLEDMADQSGYSVKEYKKRFELPFFMPKSTNVNAAGNHVTLKAYSKLSGMTIDEIKEQNGFSDDVTEKTTIGDASGNVKLSVMLGIDTDDKESAQQTFDSFKEFYGLGKEVTLDTLYKDVRLQIDEKSRENHLEELKEQEELKKKLEESQKESEEKEDSEDVEEETESDAE